MTITLRTTKGSALSHAELDGNFSDLDLRTAAGWNDITAPITTAGVPPSNAPTQQNFGPVTTPQRRESAFAIGDYVFVTFHVNHDVKPGGLGVIHMHWSTSGTDTNTVKWEYTTLMAKGFGQEAFTTHVCTVEQAASGTAWTHMVSECAIEDAVTLAEPDTLLLVTVRRISNGGTDNADSVFGLEIDWHYQADRDTTPNKAPNFYG